MLLIDLYVTDPCKAGTDLSEVVEVGQEEYQTVDGKTRRRPRYTGRYISGLPLGTGSAAVPAPLDLATGDLVRVAQVGRDVWDVQRQSKKGGKVVWDVVWTNEALHAAEDARQEDALAVLAARKAAR